MMRHDMKTKLLLSLSFALSLTAFANPTDKSLEELSKHVPYEVMFFGAVEESLIAQREDLMYALANNAKLTDAERNKALEIYDTYAQGYFEALNTPAVKAELKKTYLSSSKSIFNQKEVDAQIAFYGSTDGQNALKKQPVMASTYLQNASTATASTAKSYTDKHSKKLQEDLDKILKKK